MINSNIQIDISVINLFLDYCSTNHDYKLGISGYNYSMMKNVPPNEITFGIMIKIFGFARNLSKAFDLLDLMKVFKIKPSIIIYTNLVHISFYNKNPKKAELSYTLFRKDKGKGDKLLYSKMIDGLIRFKEINKIKKYIKYTFEDKCSLKDETIKKLRRIYSNDEVM